MSGLAEQIEAWQHYALRNPMTGKPSLDENLMHELPMTSEISVKAILAVDT